MKGRSSPFHPKESLALVPARDRERLERLCRYVGRPALATERLSELPDCFHRAANEQAGADGAHKSHPPLGALPDFRKVIG